MRYRWRTIVTLLVAAASLWLLPQAEGQNLQDQGAFARGFGPVFVADGESGRVAVYNASNQTAVIDITFLNAADGTELLGSLKGSVIGPGGMAAAAYTEPVGGAFRTEVVGMVRVLQGNPIVLGDSGLRSSFQLVESDGRTRTVVSPRDALVGGGTEYFAPVGLLNETGRMAAFNNSTQTVVLDLDTITIATNTLLATF